ncbi:MAG: hypothetical protein QNJ40_02905, partial [Xanthomonadales bacterium]|nr:hypothetical protein [Xanthomonadales bacterium]
MIRDIVHPWTNRGRYAKRGFATLSAFGRWHILVPNVSVLAPLALQLLSPGVRVKGQSKTGFTLS